MSFLPKYLIAAIVGTAAVYVGAPYLRPYLPTADGPDGESQMSDVESRGRGNGEREMVNAEWGMGNGEWGTDAADGEVAASTTHRPNDETIPPASGPAIERSNGPTVQRFNGSTVQRTNDEPSPEVIVENVRGYTPSTERIRSSGGGVTHWGVTIVDTPFYDRDGKLRDSLIQGGTLIEQTGAKRSSKGEMALCRIWRNGNWAGSYLISTADLIRFDGGREEVDADDVDLLCKYYDLNAAVERRKEELTQKAAAANPYFAELKRKATAYNAHKKRAEELTAKRDQAKGPERSEIIAELTQLKNAESREAAEVQSLTRKYEDWKKAHPSTVNPAADPICKGCLAKMAELKPRLTAFGL